MIESKDEYLGHYKLDENNDPIPCTLREWVEMYQTESGRDRKRVAQDYFGGYMISTVFLGIDHNFLLGRPHLFETMIFGDGPGDQYQTRCTTWEEAEEMHKKAIQWIKEGCKDDE